jgi:DNA-binding transcriptional LysR family regulator
MLDPITLDQLRTFVSVIDEGSFSAAARRLSRVQSAVSHAIANLEAQLDVALFDRSSKVPTLTERGRAMLPSARRVCDEADALRRVAAGLAAGLEPVVGLCVDAVFPTTALVDLCREFGRAFPTVQLRVHTDTMEAVATRVIDGTCHLGVVGPSVSAPGLERSHLTTVRMVPVVAKGHPLARGGRVSSSELAEHVQIVLSERDGGGAPDQGVLSGRTWRIADLATKHRLLLAGLGWGNLPEHTARGDLARGRLVRIRPTAWGDDEHLLSLSAIHRADFGAGPAGRWMLGRLVELCVREVGPEPRRRKKRARPI